MALLIARDVVPVCVWVVAGFTGAFGAVSGVGLDGAVGFCPVVKVEIFACAGGVEIGFDIETGSLA